MEEAKIFQNGRSQAVRLPKEFRFSEESVFIKKLGNLVVLVPKGEVWANFFDSLELFTPDFMEDQRSQGAVNTREGL